jgi:hypothetical protein
MLCDPCRLARQVNQFAWLDGEDTLSLDPRRLARRVKELVG